MNKKNISYGQFVDKFKTKLTTDDCYTPPLVYETVLSWARQHLNIDDRPVVRPFFPGGDYEHFDYPENCVVVDNPPFSIFAKICNFYVSKGIHFLLFAPAMSSIRENYTYIGVTGDITYENGANVNTSFVTNMLGDRICVTAPELHTMIKEANDRVQKQSKKTLRKLAFPDNVLRATELHTFSRVGIHFEIHRGEGRVVSSVSNDKKGEFGKSILLSDRLAAEKLAAKKLAAKKLAAEKLAAEKLILSGRSLDIIRGLNEADNNRARPY